MIIIKTLSNIVDLHGTDIYRKDLEAAILNDLKARFLGRCYSSLLIIEIINVTPTTEVYFPIDHMDGRGRVEVRFTVKGLIYNSGEVIHDCTVTSISNTNLIVQNKHTSGIITVHGAYKRLTDVATVNNVIPIVVDRVRYNVGKPSIVITAKPYLPEPYPEVYYHIVETLSSKDTDNIVDLLRLLNEEWSKHKAIMGSVPYKGFAGIMYPYKTQRKFELTKYADKFANCELTIEALSAIRVGHTVTNGDLDQKDFLYVAETTVSDAGLTVRSSLYSVLLGQLNARLNYLTTLRGFVEYYDTPEKSEKTMVYWKAMSSMKL